MHATKSWVFIALLGIISLDIAAQHEKGEHDKEPAISGSDTPAANIPEEITSVTRHRANIGGNKIEYTAVAGTIHLKKEDGKARGAIFYIAYTRDDTADKSKRPLTFSFNGGPGSSSVWLHLGTLGPKRVLMDDEGNPYPPPYKLVNNEASILDKTDLVFIDPIGTGYSRALQGEDPQQFHGLEEDIESVGDFIRLYVTRNQRWSSPKFLIGESYGTTRASGLVNHLQRRQGMYFNGVMLVSSILNFQTARFDTGNDLPYILFLPTYSATAWYHRKLEESLQGDLEETLRASRDFALGDYAAALLKGATLPEDERGRIVAELARFTGLSPEYIEAANLRVPIFRFVDELLRDDYRRVGRLDSRFKGINRDSGGFSFGRDPSYAAIQGPYTATLNDYVRGDLKFESDLPYEILGGTIRQWNYGSFEGRYVDVSDRLRQAMTHNPHLKVFVANGYYDLATPFFATEYTFSHMHLDPEIEGNVSMAYYESGHMMYIHKPSLIKLKEDLAAFISSALIP